MTNNNLHILVIIVLVGMNLCCSSNVDRNWCVANPDAEEIDLQSFINYGCSEFNCSPIQSGGPCYEPNLVLGHASWILDKYYQSFGACKEYIGVITAADPSYGQCEYP